MESQKDISRENRRLRDRLEEAEELLAAIRSGSVDAFVTDDNRVYTLNGANRPYRVLIETMNEGAATLTEGNMVVYCNSRLARMLELPVNRVIGRSILDFMRDEDIEKVNRMLCGREGGKGRLEGMIRRESGGELPVLISCNRLETDPEGVCMVLTDLSEQKGIQRELERHRNDLEGLIAERTGELRRSEERYRNLVENAPVGMYEIDYREGRFTEVNDVLCEVTGYSRDELLSMDPADLLAEEHRKFLKERIGRILSGKEVPTSLEYRIRLKSGELRWVLLNIKFIREDGIPVMGRVTASDITSRKEAEGALHRSEKLLRTALRAADMGLWDWDLESGRVLWNEKMYSLLGHSPGGSGVTVETFFGYVHREDAPRFREHLERLIKSSASELRDEFRIVSSAGEIRWMATRGYIFRDPGGRPVRVCGVDFDITERRDSEERIRNVALFPEQNPGPVLRVGAEGRLLYANPAALPVLDSWNMQVGGSVPDEIAVGVSMSLREGADRDLELIIADRDISFTLAPVPRKDYVNLYGRDVTERREAEKQLKDSEERLRLAARAARFGSFDADLVSGELHWSPEVREIFGLSHDAAEPSPDEVPGFVHPDDTPKVRGMISDMFDPTFQGHLRREYRIIRPDGEVRCIHLIGEVNFDEEQGERRPVRARGMIVDITERKEAEEVLRERKEKFERLVDQRTRQLTETRIELEKARRLSDIGLLAATVAHELRNPLSTIEMASYNIKNKIKDPSIDRNIANIEKKVRESDRIINNLLFYSRLKKPHLEKVDIHGLLTESVENSRKKSRKNLDINTDLQSLEGLRISADPLQIGEVVDNILNNAADAVQAEGGTIRVTGSVSGGMVTIRIRDNGEGVPPEIRGRLFDPFFTTKAKGTGLGLTVCREIVKMHSGEIDIKSAPGRGTELILSLPIEKEKGEENHQGNSDS